MLDWLIDMDQRLFLLINQRWSANFMDIPMRMISTPWIWLPIYSFIIYMLFKKFGKDVWLPILFLLLVVGASDRISSGIFKPTFERKRPCNEAFLHARTPEGCSTSFGFVSSHAANHFALALALILLMKPRVRIRLLLWFWAFIIAYSRVYLGRHYPGDVLVGGLLGMIIVMLLWPLYRKLAQRFNLHSGIG